MRKFTGMRLNKTTAQMQLCISVKTQKKVTGEKRIYIYNKEGYALMRVTYPSIFEAVAYCL